MNSPRIVIIAGPNGAGKTTFAEEFLPREAGFLNFINADLIARGLSPFNAENAANQAGRIMLQQISLYVAARGDFAFETTLSGVGYVTKIRDWRARGFHVKLIFLSLPTVELSLARIRSRVILGGHDVPEDVVRRRFHRGLENFHNIYSKIVNDWILYDNSGSTPTPLESGGNS
ncbi:MAG: zeta toxin family protein [Planctomycetes bacterium]|nr:zeta toxin family protein [Planctomycetota bacterium]